MPAGFFYFTDRMIIAIDGFSSCGKSTLAKDLARALDIQYIDSGAMYRAVSLYLLKNNIPYSQPAELYEALNNINIDIMHENAENRIILNNEDVTHEIRSMAVNQIVSEVAAVSCVRKKLVELQRKMAAKKSIVMDGRDIGSIVFPNADFKFFITADIEIRALRRYQELKTEGQLLNLSEIRANLEHRDHTDSTRADSPLIQTEDAILIDNSFLNREEQLQLALNVINSKKSP